MIRRYQVHVTSHVISVLLKSDCCVNFMSNYSHPLPTHPKLGHFNFPFSITLVVHAHLYTHLSSYQAYRSTHLFNTYPWRLRGLSIYVITGVWGDVWSARFWQKCNLASLQAYYNLFHLLSFSLTGRASLVLVFWMSTVKLNPQPIRTLLELIHEACKSNYETSWDLDILSLTVFISFSYVKQKIQKYE